ncbi:MAG: uroporphyrinogen decarboxylase [Acidobacteriota bacterium]|nr:MAG: uroporphyrinogen decarboxylase [Acidobacteriota bacterium]
MTRRLLVDALACRPTPRRPLWIMRQAGRYLPEYRALREKYTFEQLCASPELAAEVTLQPIRRFPLDAAIIFADLMSPLAALGVDFRFDPGPVVAEPVRTARQVDALRDPAPEEIAPEVPAALRLVRAELPAETALLGFAGAPLSLAAYLVEGQGSRGAFPALRALLARDPELFDRLLARLARLSADYLIEQARAGADAVQVFDTWAGLLARRDWLAHVRPHLAALLERVGQAGVPRILFVNDAPHLIADYAALPCEALACDWRLELAQVRELAGPQRAVQGNLDPAILAAGPEITRRAARELLASVPARGHVVNLGHGILPDAPIDSVHALIETVHAERLEDS